MGLLNLFSRRNNQVGESDALPAAGKPVCETLENRLLMSAAKVINVIGDNRGQVLVYVDQVLQRNTLNRTNVKLFTAGTDGLLNTPDDVNRNVKIGWNATGKRIVIYATDLEAGEEYRIKLFSTRILNESNEKLDGEFTGTLPSGNGTESGYFEAKLLNDTTDTPVAQFFTTAGNIALRLRGDAAPNTVDNFIAYLDSGSYDKTIFHRSGRTDTVNGPINIIQGGGFTGPFSSTHIPTFSPIDLEAGLDNDRGTIAMARTSSPDSATSEFFFNTDDNAFLNPIVPGEDGYAAFGTIISGLATIDAIFALPTGSATAGQFIPVLNGDAVYIVRAALQNKLNPL